ncbi:SDR family oxidoreductase [Nitrosopumilus sp. K4]|nr:SDR family oxidoreductase [Nitrosopumilus sp. K4]
MGSKGFIGSNLVTHLKNEGHECYTPEIRTDNINNKNLGNVIFAIGVSNFVEKPFEAVNAHVCALSKILQKTRFDSFLYFSSGRVYYNGTSTNEDDSLSVNPMKINDLYNISKAMGESICIASGKENVRIVRPSNVTGSDFSSNLFIPSILRDAVDKGKISLRSTLDSEKDYVYIGDVVNIATKISISGKHSIYNIAFGKNTTSKKIIDEIIANTGCELDIQPNSSKFSFPTISIEKIKNEFGFEPTPFIPKIKTMIENYKKFKNS